MCPFCEILEPERCYSLPPNRQFERSSIATNDWSNVNTIKIAKPLRWNTQPLLGKVGTNFGLVSSELAARWCWGARMPLAGRS